MKNIKNTIIISAFPCCGKSYCYNHYQDSYSMLDSDSSQFSWEKDENGKNTNIRNPAFPDNYIKHIIENIGKADFIFVSSHKVVREALKENKIKHISVYPDFSCKEEYLQRAKDRGSPDSFIKMLLDNWDVFYNELHNESPEYVIKQELGKGMYLDKKMLDTFNQYNRWFKVFKGEIHERN